MWNGDHAAVRSAASLYGGAPVLAVQWHPEWATDADGQSQAFFRLLGEDMRRARQGKAA